MSPTRTTQETLARAQDRLGTGRLGSYAVMGAALGSIPLPIVPFALGARLRGALLHDVARRHGLSLSKEARAVLAAPFAPPALQGTLGSLVSFAATRVLKGFGPFYVLNPLQGGLSTYVLGRLFHRYLAEIRDERAVRIDAEEARRVRSAIEHAFIHAVTTAAPVDRVESTEPEDVRDEVTKVTDGILAAAASLPTWLTRRLDAAFDASMQR